jgi:hypothetical protein
MPILGATQRALMFGWANEAHRVDVGGLLPSGERRIMQLLRALHSQTLADHLRLTLDPAGMDK